jgi:hypothetical protein
MEKMPEIEYPENGDSAFKEITVYKKRMALLNWIEPRDLDQAIALACHESADFLLDNVSGKVLWGHPDRFFFPICFLYRHSFELLLKQVIQYGIWMGGLDEGKLSPKPLYGHDLKALWDVVKPIVKDLNPKGDAHVLRAAEHILMEFHDYDPTGHAFRYSFNKEGKPSLKDDNRERRIDIDNFQRVAKKLYNFLEGVLSQIQDHWEHRNEWP